MQNTCSTVAAFFGAIPCMCRTYGAAAPFRPLLGLVTSHTLLNTSNISHYYMQIPVVAFVRECSANHLLGATCKLSILQL
jgi:hypothetical protein